MKLFTAIAFLFLCLGSTVHAQTEFEFGEWQASYDDESCVMTNKIDYDSLSIAEINKAELEISQHGVFFLPSVYWMYFIKNKDATITLGTTRLKIKTNRNYKVDFNFDNKISNTINGVTLKGSQHWLGFKFKSFNKMMLPYFKKHNKVNIKVKGNEASEVSLKGFSKAYEKFEECVISGGGALKKADPFD